ncbi:MAG TPA: hypothetical protein VGV37_06420 [Aliidongia sp.]|uniref:hypothetical protein n=1 Tax=Aliidongia sp. TaxID=1914230 RepID=UPI002DDD6B0E|nr:hypothetical protein [Aliidongia sp.]HEV2674160.1 hypothetical protein [Aliidongia sp.]
MSYLIQPATLAHVRALAPRLREGDRAEVEAVGAKPRHLMHKLWRTSHTRRTAFVDGEIAAMWGCAGTLLSPIGEIWLLTAPPVERVPVAFVKEARRGISEMLETHAILVSGVLASYGRAIRLMEILGFEIGAEYSMPCGALFRELRMERSA